MFEQPSSRQYENAMKVTAQVHKNNPLRATMALKGINIPLFRAQGLVLTRSNGEVRLCLLRAISVDHPPTRLSYSYKYIQ